jgi:hypothetical protein
MSTIDAKIHEYINEHLDEKLPRIVSEKLKQIQPLPMWMTETQLAEYWQLRNKDGELTVDSIRKWTARPEDEHPLPCGNMGDMRRYNREEVDQWARKEAVRQRTLRAQRRQSKTGTHLHAVGE